MIVDCVLFGGELEMLKGRLSTLGEHVDKFLIVEGSHQFQNQHKGFSLNENMWAISGHEEKTTYIPVDSLLSGDPWRNENYQRRAFEPFLNDMGLSGDDIVTICDVDEWWTPGDVENTGEVSTMNSRKFNMSLHWYHKREQTGVIARWRFLKGKDLDFVRRQQRHTFKEVNESVHLTSMGSYDYLVAKMTGYAHSEFNVPDIRKHLLDQWVNGHFYGETFTEVEFDESTPDYIRNRMFPADWYRKRGDELTTSVAAKYSC